MSTAHFPPGNVTDELTSASSVSTLSMRDVLPSIAPSVQVIYERSLFAESKNTKLNTSLTMRIHLLPPPSSSSKSSSPPWQTSAPSSTPTPPQPHPTKSLNLLQRPTHLIPFPKIPSSPRPRNFHTIAHTIPSDYTAAPAQPPPGLPNPLK